MDVFSFSQDCDSLDLGQYINKVVLRSYEGHMLLPILLVGVLRFNHVNKEAVLSSCSTIFLT